MQKISAMGQKLFLIIAICFSVWGNAQQRYVYNFEKLTILDTITDAREIEKWKHEAAVYDGTLFRTPRYLKDGVEMHALFCQREGRWIVYEPPFSPDFVEFLTYTDDRKYALFEVVGRSRSTRSWEAEMRQTYILNLEKGSCTAVLTGEYILEVTYENEDDEFGYPSYFETDTPIILQGHTLTLLESVFDHDRDASDRNEEFGAYDSQSGMYQLSGEQLVKTHYYDAIDKRMKPLVYAGGLAIGMDLRTLEDILSPYDEEVGLESVPQWMYGYDSEEYGYEVRVSGEQHCFVIVEESDDGVRRITHLAVISPKVTVRGLNAGMTVGEVLERFPDATPGYDVVNDGEYMYIKDLQLRLMFLTEAGNRIARYEATKNDDYKPVEILDRDRKVDYIMVVR